VFYLCLAMSAAWLVYFGYLLLLDNQLRDIRRRQAARSDK
jgi:hypothetical protein